MNLPVPVPVWVAWLIVGAAAALALLCVGCLVWRCRVKRTKKRLLGSPEALARLHKSAQAPLHTPADVLNTRITPGLKFQTHAALKTTADSQSGDIKEGSPQVGTKLRTPSSTTISFLDTDSDVTDTTGSSFLSAESVAVAQQQPQLSTQSWPLVPPSHQHYDEPHGFDAHHRYSVQRSAHSTPEQHNESLYPMPAQHHESACTLPAQEDESANGMPAQNSQLPAHDMSSTAWYTHGPQTAGTYQTADPHQQVQPAVQPAWGTASSAAFATARASMLIQEVFDTADPGTMPHWAPRDDSFRNGAHNFLPLAALHFNGSRTVRDLTSSLHSSLRGYYGDSSKASSLFSTYWGGLSPRESIETGNTSSLFSTWKTRNSLSHGGSATTVNSPREGMDAGSGMQWLDHVNDAFSRASRSQPSSPRGDRRSPRSRAVSRFQRNPAGHGPNSPPGSFLTQHRNSSLQGLTPPQRRKHKSRAVHEQVPTHGHTDGRDAEQGSQPHQRSSNSRYAHFKAVPAATPGLPSEDDANKANIAKVADDITQPSTQPTSTNTASTGHPVGLQRPPPLLIEEDMHTSSNRADGPNARFPPWLRARLHSLVDSPCSPAGTTRFGAGMFSDDPIPHLMQNFRSSMSQAGIVGATATSSDGVTHMLHAQYRANMRTSSSTDTNENDSARDSGPDSVCVLTQGAVQELYQSMQTPEWIDTNTPDRYDSMQQPIFTDKHLHDSCHASQLPISTNPPPQEADDTLLPPSSTHPVIYEAYNALQPSHVTSSASHPTNFASHQPHYTSHSLPGHHPAPLARNSAPPDLKGPALSPKALPPVGIQPSRTHHSEFTDLRKHLMQLSAASMDPSLSDSLQERRHNRTLSNAFSDLSSVDTARVSCYSHGDEPSPAAVHGKFANPFFENHHPSREPNGTGNLQLDFDNPFFDSDRQSSSDGSTAGIV